MSKIFQVFQLTWFHSGVPTSLPSTCLSSASSCACLTAALQSADCFLHDTSADDIKREKVLEEKSGGSSLLHNEGSHRTFKIYFVLSTLLLATCLALYCILRLIQVCQILSNNFLLLFLAVQNSSIGDLVTH